MARTFQLPRPFHTLSVAENLRIPLLYAVKARLGPHLARPSSTRAASNICASSGSITRRQSCRAI